MKAAMVFVLLMLATAAGAADNVLLIQTLPGGSYKVWHSEGESVLTDEEIVALEVSAKTGGGDEVPTGAGPARAYETSDGVTISLLAARNDKTVLLDRDGCGHVRLWHSAGATMLSTDEITDIVISALPGGGKRLTIGDHYVKGFLTELGVTATLWKIPAR